MAGFLGGKNPTLYQLTQQDFTVPSASPQTLPPPGTLSFAQYSRENASLWFALVQGTRAAASGIVRRFEQANAGQLDGRGAWFELVKVYGTVSKEEKGARLLQLENELRAAHCDSPRHATDFLYCLIACGAISKQLAR